MLITGKLCLPTAPKIRCTPNRMELIMDINTSILISAAASIAAFIGYLVASSITKRLIIRFAAARGIDNKRSLPIRKVLRALWIAVLFIVLGFIWGYDLQGLYAASAGLFALVGIAFFAVWSILSNITTSIIIFFKFPMKIGDTVRLPEVDGLSGKVVDITLFHIILKDGNGHTIAVPNNVAIQKILEIERV